MNQEFCPAHPNPNCPKREAVGKCDYCGFDFEALHLTKESEELAKEAALQTAEGRVRVPVNPPEMVVEKTQDEASRGNDVVMTAQQGAVEAAKAEAERLRKELETLKHGKRGWGRQILLGILGTGLAFAGGMMVMDWNPWRGAGVVAPPAAPVAPTSTTSPATATASVPAASPAPASPAIAVPRLPADNQPKPAPNPASPVPERPVVPKSVTVIQAKETKTAYEPEMVVIPGKRFELGRTEVTQGQWRAVIGSNPSYSQKCGDDCPVERVSWDDVQEYLKRLNAKTGKHYRLPTEAEWEYGCDGGRRSEYCGGEDVDAVGWHLQNGGLSAHPVGKKSANGYGLYDMSGNVWEWTSDCYNGDCSMRILRGGSWSDSPRNLRSAFRERNFPDDRSSTLMGCVGFRIARTLP